MKFDNCNFINLIVRTPIETDVAVKIREIVQSILDTGKDDALHACPLIPKTPDEMQLLLDFAQFHKPIFMPKQVKRLS